MDLYQYDIHNEKLKLFFWFSLKKVIFLTREFQNYIIMRKTFILIELVSSITFMNSQIVINEIYGGGSKDWNFCCIFNWRNNRIYNSQ